MKIKPMFTEKTEIDVKEWNDEIKVYFKPLKGYEALVFNDLLLTFYSSETEPEKRYEAAFKAALMSLVDENDAPFLEQADKDAMMAAAPLPFYRMFNAANQTRKEGEPIETAKKN